MNASEGATMIGKSVKIVGDLSGNEDLVMDGELQGTIRLPGARLTIGPAARVRGDIAAKEIVVFGRLEGEIRAVGRVELRASAVVQGNIYAGTLSIEDDAAFRGQVDPTRAGEAIPERPVAAARPSTLVSSVPAPEPACGDDKAAGQAAPLFAETEA